MKALVLGIALLVAAPACDERAAKQQAVAASVLPVTQHGIAWYQDAPEAALAAARAADKPVFVDLWAPWCHTCLSMQQYVLNADKLAGLQRSLIFLAINTENPKNADFLRSFPVQAWPTFYLLDAS